MASSKNFGWGTGIAVIIWIAVRVVMMMGSQEAVELTEKGDRLIVAMEAANNSAESLRDLFETITDASTASKAAPRIDNTFSIYHKATEKAVNLERQVNEIGTVKVSKSQSRKIDEINSRTEQLGKKAIQIGKQVAQEIERIGALDDLPIEFWEAFTPGVCRGVIMLGNLQANSETNYGFTPSDLELHNKYLELFKKYGYRRTANITLESFSEKQVNEVVAELRQTLGQDVEITHWYSGNQREAVILLAPVDGLEEIAQSLPQQSGFWQDDNRRNITIEGGASSRIDAFQKRVEKDLESARARAEQHRPPEMKLPEDVPDVFAENFPQPRTFSVPRDFPKPRDFPAPRSSQNLPTDPRDVIEMMEKMQEVMEIAEGTQLSPEMIPAEDDPEYYMKLAELMVDDYSWSSREEVIDRLLRIDRDDIKDKEVVKQIAKNFRQLAYEQGHLRGQNKIIRGLVKYAGKYSVPILIDMLGNESMRVSPELFSALAKYPSRDSADAVAKYLGDFFNHKQAVSCLRRMGVAAEPTLLDVAPTSDPKISLAAVELLGDVGTEACFPLLRKGMKSRNPQVRQASKTSLRKIRQRGEASK